MSLIYLTANNLEDLIDLCGFVQWMFIGLAIGALILMRHTEKEKPRPFKVIK